MFPLAGLDGGSLRQIPHTNRFVLFARHDELEFGMEGGEGGITLLKWPRQESMSQAFVPLILQILMTAAEMIKGREGWKVA